MAKSTREILEHEFRRGALEDVVRAFLKVRPQGAAERVRAEDHKMWALVVLLRDCGDQELIDWTLEQMRARPVGVFPEQSEATVALLGASKRMIETIVPKLVKGRRHNLAASLLEMVGRDFTPQEAEEIARRYIGGGSYSTEELHQIAGIVSRVVGENESRQFRADVKAHLDHIEP